MNLVGDNIVMQCQMVDTLGTSVSYQPSEQENGKTGFCSQTTRQDIPDYNKINVEKGGGSLKLFCQSSLQETPPCQTNSAGRTLNRQNDLQTVTGRSPRSVATGDSFISDSALSALPTLGPTGPCRVNLVAGPCKLQQPPSHTPTCTVTRSPLASCTPRASRTRSLTDARGLGQETEEQRRRAPRRRRAPSMPWPGRPVHRSSPLHPRRSGARVALPPQPRAVHAGPLLGVLPPKARKVQRPWSTVQTGHYSVGATRERSQSKSTLHPATSPGRALTSSR